MKGKMKGRIKGKPGRGINVQGSLIKNRNEGDYCDRHTFFGNFFGRRIGLCENDNLLSDSGKLHSMEGLVKSGCQLVHVNDHHRTTFA